MRMTRWSKRGVPALVALSGVLLPGCGYTEEQWQAQMDKYDRLATKERVSEQKLDQLNTDLEAERQHVSELEDKMKALGIDIEAKNTALTDMGATLADRERALAEYKLKAKQLEAIKGRFELLRSKLDELSKIGLEVRIRKNRMVISLPGDVLFDSGRDTLKKEGRDILKRVAGVISNDPSLLARDYQVAGHTDSKSLRGGPFGDNWGLSVMRSRQVLLFLVDPNGGALPTQHLSAAGFADTDPIASNDTDEGRQANRRCELIVLPNVDEMLDLRSIAATEPAAPPPEKAPEKAPLKTPEKAPEKPPAKAPEKAPAKAEPAKK